MISTPFSSAVRASFLPSALASLCLLSVGCASQQTQHESLQHLLPTNQVTIKPNEKPAKIKQSIASTHALSELLILIGSFENTMHEPATHQAPKGPQLVAGDWLAWQCAIAGGYLNSSEHQTKSAPAFAEAETLFVD